MNRFPYGKYVGELISDVIIKDPQYVKWAVKTGMIILPKNLKL